MRPRRLVPAALLIGFAVLAMPGTAGATISGPCQASGDFATTGLVDASQTSASISDEDEVHWAGAIEIPNPTDNMSYSGSITLKAPPPVGEITIDSWDGETDKISNSGNRHYDFSAYPPFKATVSGSHTQAGVTCSGSIELEVGGSLGAIGLASLGLTVVSGAGLVFAGMARVGGIR